MTTTPAIRRRENALNMQIVAAPLMGALAFVTGIAQERSDTLSANGVREGFLKLTKIRLRSASYHSREEQVSLGVADG